MAKYTGPVCRLCRREGVKLFLKGTRCMTEKGAIERAEVSDAELRDRDEIDRPRIALKFDRRHWARLRHLIDTLNKPEQLAFILLR